MLKSQVKIILNSLIDKGYLAMEMAKNDKRSKVIYFIEYYSDKYLKEHKCIIQIMNNIKNKLGL